MLDRTRQQDIADPAVLRAVGVDVVGVGAVGGMTAVTLAKMGVGRLRLFDPDIVETVNLACQMYALADLSVAKALAAQRLCRELGDAEVEAVVGRGEDSVLEGIVVLAVDSMVARRSIWERRIVSSPRVAWLIDARMGAETGTIYTVRPGLSSQRRMYEMSLYTDEEAMPLPCTGRAIIYNTLWIAALISRQVKRIAMRQLVEWRIDFSLDDLTLFVDSHV